MDTNTILKSINGQYALINMMETCLRNFKKQSKDRLKAPFINGKISEYERFWKRIQDMQEEILILQASTEDSLDEKSQKYFDEETYEKVEDTFHTGRALMQIALNSLPDETRVDPSTSNINQSIHSHSSDLKLPRINLPNFSGDYRAWTSFFDLFKSLVHDNATLSPVQKLQFLKTSLSGEAAQLLRHYQTTNENYDHAFKTLIQRYDNKRILVNSQLQSLFSQPQTKENSRSIRSLLDTTNECLQNLSNLGVNTNSWDVLIIYLGVQKLSQESHHLWEQKLSGSRDLPTLDQFREFLESRFRTLEIVGVSHQTQNPTSSQNQRFNQKFKSATVALQSTQATKPKLTCSFCKEEHSIRQCEKFANLDEEKRRDHVMTSNLCINCLGKGHRIERCSSRFRCLKCKKRHHTLLHRNTELASNLVLDNSAPSTSANCNFSTEPLVNIAEGAETRTILLATALITVRAENGRSTILRALIDQGSQINIISERAVQQLQLTREKSTTKVIGIGKTENIISNGRVQFNMESLSTQFDIKIEAIIMKTVTDIMPSRLIRTTSWSCFSNLSLADPTFNTPGQIDLLLSAEVYAIILQQGLLKYPDGIIAQNTLLGWIISGGVSTPNQTSRCNHISIDTKILDNRLRSFWELENIPSISTQSKEEQECENHYAANVERKIDGRYVVKIPYKDKQLPIFGRSKHIAIARLYQMETKFAKDASFYNEYSNCIEEYYTMDHMHIAETSENENIININGNIKYKCNYLPHHAVIKESSTSTKLRVVFNASSRTSDGSTFNQKMLVGPTIQDDLFSILIRWRKHQFVFTADIHKMYRQIHVTKEDANLQRIVWRPSSREQIKEYCLHTVTFGTASAPFLAIRTLKQLSIDEQENFPAACKILANDFYVDDLMSGASSIEKAKNLQKNMNILLEKGGFQLRKWASNQKQILEGVPEANIELKTNLDISAQQEIKTLGIMWKPLADKFGYKMRLKSAPVSYTKRTVLSEIASLFDPIGWLTPIIIKAKILMQDLWRLQLGWDEKLPKNIVDDWINYKSDLSQIEEFTVPRWLHTTEDSSIEIHGFSDASMQAYAAVVYLRSTNANGKSNISLIAAKSKVAPLKVISLPKLELCAAWLLSKLVKKITNSLKLENSTLYCWSDSQISLAWIRAQPNRWNTFVANRVATIQENLPYAEWRYVPSKENSADCASRGIPANELKLHSLWWEGPAWLMQEKKLWPSVPTITETDVEQRKTAHTATIKSDFHQLQHNFSALTKLIRVTAYVFRFIDRCKKSAKTSSSWLTSDEISSALAFWIKETQHSCYQDEIKSIKNKQQLNKKSAILNLNPFLDNEGILRVGGRLTHSNLPYNEKHPIIIPKSHHLTGLIIDNAHHNALHGGTQLTMNIIRKRFWIIDCRNQVRHRIQKCVVCFRQKAVTQEQLMGELPKVRVVDAKAFCNIGVDFCGPFELKVSKLRTSRTEKGYVAVFVCMAVKAIHLEVVSDLSTSAFLAAYRRFVSRRGLPRNIYSDNATNFVGADRQLKKNFEKAVTQSCREVAEFIVNDKTTWHFIPPGSPTFGGLWESGVKSVKHHLRRVAGNARLTFEEMTTLMAQIEAVLNSRPLTALTADPNDHSVLTPGHFITGNALKAPPEPILLDINEHKLNRWLLIQKIQQCFWKRWSQEYLSRLQQRPKWLTKNKTIEKGMLVLIKDENLPPTRWALGRIVDTHKGQDDLIRVVTIRTKNTSLKRAINKICILPIDYSDISTE